LSDTPLEYSKVELKRWIYLMRALDQGRPVTEIAEEIEVTYKTALGMAHTVREELYQHRDEQPLEGEVEGDDIHLKGGQQGYQCQHRPARQRALKARGRGTYQSDRPLIGLWTQRDSPRLVIRMLPDAGKRTLFRFAHRYLKPGIRIDTDSWRGYNLLGQVYDHRTVKHSECYVKDGVHCNTAEAEWSVFKPWWATYRGGAKRHIYLYLAQYEFRRNHRQLSSLERLEKMIGFLFRLLFYLLFRLLFPSFSIQRAISYR
jgi:transposase-like protein